MQGRELGCKTLGCGAVILIVMLFFYAMISATENLAKQAKAKLAKKSSATAAQNLQAVAISIASYEAATGHLPPTTSAAALKNALSPKYLSDTAVLADAVTGKPYQPNPAVSGKKRKQFPSVREVPLLASEPNREGTRTVLLLSGEVAELNAATWGKFTAPRTLPPAPAGTPTPGASPVPSPP